MFYVIIHEHLWINQDLLMFYASISDVLWIDEICMCFMCIVVNICVG
jgi:hypothetical protein